MIIAIWKLSASDNVEERVSIGAFRGHSCATHLASHIIIECLRGAGYGLTVTCIRARVEVTLAFFLMAETHTRTALSKRRTERSAINAILTRGCTVVETLAVNHE